MTKKGGTKTCNRHQIKHSQEVKYVSKMCKILGEPSYTYLLEMVYKESISSDLSKSHQSLADN